MFVLPPWQDFQLQPLTALPLWQLQEVTRIPPVHTAQGGRAGCRGRGQLRSSVAGCGPSASLHPGCMLWGGVHPWAHLRSPDLGKKNGQAPRSKRRATWVRIPRSRSEVQGGPTVPLPSGLQSPLSCGRGQWERGRWGSSKAQGPLLTCFKGDSALNVCHPCSPISALSLKTRTSPLDGCLLARAACPPPLPPLAHPC